MDFWFEFASTYSYPAAMRATALAEAAGVALEYKPFLLGPIFAAQGLKDSPFNVFPEKGRYMWRDLERLCDDYGLPFKRPSRFPQNGLSAARIAFVGAGAAWGPSFVRAVYRANFGEDRDISRIEVLREILEGLSDFTGPVEGVLETATSPDVKLGLREQTERAQALGIFGAPSFVVGREVFWGQDRLEQALRWAKAQNP